LKVIHPKDFFLALSSVPLLKAESVVLALLLTLVAYAGNRKDVNIRFVGIKEVKVDDPFWSPKFRLWSTTTANDVFDKFEGKHEHIEGNHNTFSNFDQVARGDRGTNGHLGAPWFDGLIYESIRGISDFLAQYPDPQMEARIDGYIDRIEAAQKADPDGYLETYTILNEPDHPWGENGGLLRWQHDVYNAGMMIEAGVHYYQATGKTKLLAVATRFANYMTEYMGAYPKKNVVPAHSGPEEAMIKLYWLYKNDKKLKKKVGVPVHEQDYWNLATFWIENRGNHCGYPLWGAWGNNVSEKWIRDNKYSAPEFGNHSRPSFGTYAQDSIPVFQQTTIEGHAVRATLLATGIATAAIENRSPQYIETAQRLWDNMVGKRMFVTGGVGAVHFDEKFGPDYYLPTDAYLETCAAVGVGFFSRRMNELTGDAKYMDELECALYNNILAGISLEGNRYTYQNPLNADSCSRWIWHSCPCCPPMFLKIMSVVPGYIYAYKQNQIYINLFISSESNIILASRNTVKIKQVTQYPWDGKISVNINPSENAVFTLRIRIPGWALGKENTYGLYQSNLKPEIRLTVNGISQEVIMANGYAEINREWTKGDIIELVLPMQPRIITANEKVETLNGLSAIASGPVIYCLEEADNKNLNDLKLDAGAPFNYSFHKDLLNGINVITGSGITAIPYYAVGNRQTGKYKVWIPATADQNPVTIDAATVENRLSKNIYGACIEDVNHEVYGGLFDQKIFGGSFEENYQKTAFDGKVTQSGMWDIFHENNTAQFSLDSVNAFNGKYAQKIIYTGGNGKAGLINGGLNRWGIAVQSGKTYQGRIYLRSQNFAGKKVYVALQSADGQSIYAVQELKNTGTDWAKFPFALTSNTTDNNARFAVWIENKGTVWLDQAVLESPVADRFHNLPFRADIGNAMVAQGLTFLRYGGSMVNAAEYRFKKMIGDPDLRPPYRGFWYPYSTNGFGIEEFLKFCEAAGFEAAFAINIEETAQDAADMVEYLNGDVSTEWGAKRAKNGHPAPYHVKYIEIGNEEVLPNGDVTAEYTHYIERFNDLYKAMKAKDPNLKFINSAWWRPKSDNVKRVFDALNGKADYWDYHPWTDDLNSSKTIETELRQMQNLFKQWDINTTMKCAIFEENGNTHNLQRSIVHATVLNAVRRMGDFVLTSCAANALQPFLQNSNGWDQGQIFFTPSQVWGQPTFYAQQMASANHLPQRVKQTPRGLTLDVTATTDENNQTLVIHVVNTTSGIITQPFVLQNFNAAGKAQITVLQGNPKDENTSVQPEKIVPQQSYITVTNSGFTHTFPPYSYTIIRIRK